MEIALCNEMLRPLPFSSQCDLAARLGYDALELAPFTLAAEPHRLGGAEVSDLRRLIRDTGLGVAGLHWLLLSPPGLSITSADAEVRRATIDVLQQLIILCAELGGKVLVHGSPAQRQIVAGDDPAEARKRAVDMLSQAADGASAAGVIYCLEALPETSTNFVNRIAEAAQIVERVGNPALRTMIDTCAAVTSESEPLSALVEHWVPTGLIGHVHLNDSTRRAPGQGGDEFAPVLGALLRSGYSKCVSIEPFVYEPDGPTCAAQAIGYVRGILEVLRR
jgi:sugar phosphate isomerase/epimerase